MIRLNSIKVPLDYTGEDLLRSASRLLALPPSNISSCVLARQSVDARRKSEVHFVVNLDVSLRSASDEKRIAARLASAQGGATLPWTPPVFPKAARPRLRPVVIGLGPAGLFASLVLAEAGLCPLILERGQDVDTRTRDVEAYWRDGQSAFNPASNVQFGEGGAGAFSDGKLNTGIKDPYAAYVLQTLARFGAPPEILTDAKPHVGTDRLVGVVRAMREHLLSSGAEVRFGARVTELVRRDGRIAAVRTDDDEIPAEHVILAVGHSARDTFQSLYDTGFTLVPKPFSIGARIEHPQRLIDEAQYGPAAGHPRLGPADYKLSLHLPSGRGVYTFCMCPGGEVVAAASEPDSVVTNGMSRHARACENANSALLVGVGPEDFDSDHPLAGMEFQRRIEQQAFVMGGGTGCAPCQTVGDFLRARASSSLARVTPSYRPGVVPSDLSKLLPDAVVLAMREALPQLDRKLRGFARPDALLTGPETRSSSPLRMPRDERTLSVDCDGLHPCGEGAGFAGGITSAAVDGIRCAASILQALSEAI